MDVFCFYGKIINSILFYFFFKIHFQICSYLKLKYSFWTKQGLKIENFFVSFLHNFSSILNREKSRRQQGKLFGFYKGLTLVLSCGDADVLKLILDKDFHNFTNRKVKLTLFSLKTLIFIL